jgi:hypothetical protein
MFPQGPNPRAESLRGRVAWRLAPAALQACLLALLLLGPSLATAQNWVRPKPQQPLIEFANGHSRWLFGTGWFEGDYRLMKSGAQHHRVAGVPVLLAGDRIFPVGSRFYLGVGVSFLFVPNPHIEDTKKDGGNAWDYYLDEDAVSNWDWTRTILTVGPTLGCRFPELGGAFVEVGGGVGPMFGTFPTALVSGLVGAYFWNARDFETGLGLQVTHRMDQDQFWESNDGEYTYFSTGMLTGQTVGLVLLVKPK